MPAQGWSAIYILAFGIVVTLGALMVPKLRRGRWRPLLLVLMMVMGVWSTANYFRWGKLHRYPETHMYHLHDLFHYEVGAKYFPELGFYHLYDCVLVAQTDLRADAGFRRHPPNAVRSLRHPLYSTPGYKVVQTERQVCYDLFGEDRWAEFKQDIAVYTQLGNRYFRVILFDLGFNPPPTWSVIGHPLADAVPISQPNMERLPYIDIVLIYGIGTLAIGWAFGPEAIGLYLLVLGTNFLSHFGWTGGSFCRMMWLGALVVGVSMLRKERHWLAGIFLGLATVFRMFPAVFAFGAVWAVAWQAYHRPERRRALAELVGSGLTTGAIMFGASLVMFGLEPWHDFFVKIIEHGDTYYVNHIGFKKAAVYQIGIAGQNFHGVDGLVRFGQWQLRLLVIYAPPTELYTALRIGLVVAALYLGRKLPAWESAITVGGTLFFVGSIPANYYYAYLALFPVVWYTQKGGVWPTIRMALILALLTVMQVLPIVFRDDLIYNGHMNRYIFLFLCLMWASYAAQQWMDYRQSAVSPVAKPEGQSA